MTGPVLIEPWQLHYPGIRQPSWSAAPSSRSPIVAPLLDYWEVHGFELIDEPDQPIKGLLMHPSLAAIDRLQHGLQSWAVCSLNDATHSTKQPPDSTVLRCPKVLPSSFGIQFRLLL
jgi:hypothetical protein